MTDAEFAELAERYAPLIWKTGKAELDLLGRPAGLIAEDLFAAGLEGLWEAARETGTAKSNGFPFGLRATVRVRSRIKDAIKQAQVGAVTARRVQWPRGSYRESRYPNGIFGRFPYSTSVGVDTASVLRGRPTRDHSTKDSGVYEPARRRGLRLGLYSDFTEGVVTRIDLDRTIAAIPDPIDRLLVGVLRCFTEEPLREPPEAIKAALEDGWSRYKSPMNVTLWLVSGLIPRSEARMRLQRAGHWIEACSKGQRPSTYDGDSRTPG